MRSGRNPGTSRCQRRNRRSFRASLATVANVVGQVKRRDKSEPLIARSSYSIKGKLYVLVDGNSSSAAEIFAHAMQLEQRAVIFGDRPAGFVNEGRQFALNGGSSTSVILYGVVVTAGAIVMRDGRTLEKTGVEPDVWLVPSPKDLAPAKYLHRITASGGAEETGFGPPAPPGEIKNAEL